MSRNTFHIKVTDGLMELRDDDPLLAEIEAKDAQWIKLLEDFARFGYHLCGCPRGEGNPDDCVECKCGLDKTRRDLGLWRQKEWTLSIHDHKGGA